MDEESQQWDDDPPRESEARNEAILEAEIRSLRDTLADYGVLEVPRLEELSGAEAWEQGAFHAALDAGIRRGVLQRRGDDFIELPPEGG
ncbi:MAG TPA: hypothetical protein VHR88_00240 [Solirubrobacteraceae bacterium]|jgi:hypothetical protein|nr:hypothetical protein [Solirubrobacteraceae bacterium]